MFRLVLLVGLIAACGAPPTPSRTDSQPSRNVAAPAAEIPEVIVELTAAADVSHVSPDQELTVAARFHLQPGWHVYWLNPGETGLPTTARLSAPDGFEIGAARFEGPKRFESKGTVSFGYDREFAISTVVRAPSELPTEPVEIKWTAQWLACRDACVRGSGEASVKLGIASEASPSQPTHRSFFAQHEARLPRPLTQLSNARHAWQPISNGHELVIYVDGGDVVEFFPTSKLQPSLSGQALIPGQGVGALHLSFRGAPERVSGVLHAKDKRSEYFFEVDLPGPTAAVPE